jgi:hypothetical protein
MVGLFGSRCVFVEAPHPAGSAFRLPWVDGIEYLGRDPAAPELLLPTALEPNVSVSLLPAALRGYGVEPPAAVCGGNAPAVFHTGSARRLTFEQLQAWIERQ